MGCLVSHGDDSLSDLSLMKSKTYSCSIAHIHVNLINRLHILVAMLSQYPWGCFVVIPVYVSAISLVLWYICLSLLYQLFPPDYLWTSSMVSFLGWFLFCSLATHVSCILLAAVYVCVSEYNLLNILILTYIFGCLYCVYGINLLYSFWAFLFWSPVWFL